MRTYGSCGASKHNVGLHIWKLNVQVTGLHVVSVNISKYRQYETDCHASKPVVGLHVVLVRILTYK